jgi:hypothetical protein
MQARNLNNYLLATLSGHESQGIVQQVSQRIQTVIGGLFQIVEEIRATKPGREPIPKQVDTSDLFHYLSAVERADLGQLEHSFSELTIARDLVSKFKQRIIDLGLKRIAAGDVRQD